ncbi:tripartite tricarboxylate transporter substrate binding protein [Ottowia thiooxydans]|uniref:tripartite tricarboxylate transporter substrate binding protein n=1 Tax=Ottowia thiooxydans TaxID=219182 RepID=UPI00055F5546|nr:tripartite tricarboxylate transporter substrate binding protein [Ottowia thiooxydans]
MKIARRSLLAAALAPALSTLAPLTSAQGAFPSRRISVVVPFPAGGPADMVARVMQPLMQKALGETVIVENFAGVGGAIGVGKVLAAPADGHTMLLTTVAEPILPPLTMPSVRYKPEDLVLVSQLSYTHIALVVRPSLQIHSAQALLDYLKNPASKPLSYATPGSGTLYHLMGEHFKSLTGAQLIHVPYKGLAPAVNDLIGGQVDLAFLPMAGSTAKQIEAGTLRALAHTADTPMVGLPRLSELSGLKDFVYTVWTGVFLPRQTPTEVVAAVHKAIDTALQGPEFGAYTRDAGGVALTRAMPLKQAQTFYNAEAQRLQRVFQAVKLKAD